MSRVLSLILHSLASLRVTVALMFLAIVLVFAGTLAQVEQGIWTVMGQYFRTFVAWIDLGIFVPRPWDPDVSVPFPGGFTLGGLLMANLLAAHTLHFRRNARRIGVLVIHLGVVLLLLGEIVTALTATEANMTIDEGSFANYTEDPREAELAIIDPAHPEAEPGEDRVVAIPQALLERETLIGHPPLPGDIPFTIRVDRFLPNSALFGQREARARGIDVDIDIDKMPLATRGIGTAVVVVPTPVVSGTEDQTIDAPSAYITLVGSDLQELGTWLVSVHLPNLVRPIPPQEVRVGERTFLIELRFRRQYKPFRIHLIDFRHDRFTGTDIPRNFSSHIRLVNEAQHEDRQFLISMNHPLRYDGETFYQAAFKNDDRTTILQVVRNPGWLIPYVACILVALGMLIHFSSGLWRFLAEGASVRG